jgi:hypothetical protein
MDVSLSDVESRASPRDYRQSVGIRRRQEKVIDLQPQFHRKLKERERLDRHADHGAI